MTQVSSHIDSDQEVAAAGPPGGARWQLKATLLRIGFWLFADA